MMVFLKAPIMKDTVGELELIKLSMIGHQLLLVHIFLQAKVMTNLVGVILLVYCQQYFLLTIK